MSSGTTGERPRGATPEEMRDRFFEDLPRYEYRSVLGKGGMGVVFEAHDLELEMDIAIKVHFPADYVDREELVTRFKRELTLNRQVKHPNVARLHDFGKAAGYPYISMELLPGRSLASILEEEGTLAIPRMLPIFRQIALGSAAAHAVGIVHRDLKPGNVMVADDGGVAIVDFGLAHAKSNLSLTKAGFAYGTPRYMSPEQVRGEAIDGRSDIYAIGVMAFQALTGEVPFDRPSPLAVVLAQLNDPVPVEALDTHGVPEGLRAIVLRCLAKKPEDRYQTAAELGADLGLAALAPVSEAPAPHVRTPSAGVFVTEEISGRAKEAAPARVVEPHRRKRPRVLVVDDDEDLRAVVAAYLLHSGCEVLEADSGHGALELLLTEAVDFVLMDVSMPVMDGFDALRVLKSQPKHAQLPVMLMSALPERNRLAFALRSGALDFLPKPLDFELLKDKVWKVLAHLGFARPSSGAQRTS